MFSTESIERIISLGGGVSIDASKYSLTKLERFASFSSQSGATVIMRNCERFPSQSLERIASLGNGKVIFELD